MKKINVEQLGSSTTDVFKTHIQEIIQQELGCKVSKQKAWILFKNLIISTIHFTTDLPEDKKGNRTLSLAGLMKVSVQKKAPKGKKAGLVKVVENGEVKLVEDSSLPKWTVVPRISMKVSSAILNIVHYIYGQPVKLKEGQSFPEVGLYKDDAQKENNN